MVADACETLFRECQQNNWVSSGEKTNFLKRCKQDQPRSPSQPPANAFTLISQSILASEIAAAGQASRDRCRGYAGGTNPVEATAREAAWYVTPLAWLAAAVSAAFFVAGFRAIPAMEAPAGYGLGTTPSYPWERQKIL